MLAERGGGFHNNALFVHNDKGKKWVEDAICHCHKGDV